MTKENHGPYEFLGSMVVNLMNIDKSISYSFLEDELHISGRDVSAMRFLVSFCNTRNLL